jgi:cobalt-zinc-cadmium efflux system outer membrane protein
MFRGPSISTRVRSRFARSALAWSLLLGGCASTTGSGRYPAQSPQNTAESSSAWPASPRRSEPNHGQQLGRAAFVREVLTANPSIESARQGWRAALARVRQSGSFEDPMVELELAPLSVASSKAPLGYQLMLSQRLPWFGKRDLDTAVAAAEAEAAKSDFEGTKRELGATAVMLYDRYFVVQRSLEVNAQHVKLMLAMRDAAIAQVTSGRGATQDALQAEAELAHMEHDALVLVSEREIVVAQMNELLHRPPEQHLPAPPDALPAPAPLGATETQLQAEAMNARQDIAAAKQRARAAQARVARAERDGYPDFTVLTSYNSMWDMPEHRWMLGLGLNLPIFSGRRAGMADEARAMRAQLESDVSRISDSARTQVFVTLRQLNASEHVLRLFETKLLPIARERVDATRAGFVTAQNPFMAAIDAEKSLRSLELEYQVARAEYAGHRAELERALGKIPGLDQPESER